LSTDTQTDTHTETRRLIYKGRLSLAAARANMNISGKTRDFPVIV